MGWFGFFSYAAEYQVESESAVLQESTKVAIVGPPAVVQTPERAENSQTPADESKPAPNASQHVGRSDMPVVESRPKVGRRFSFQSLAFIRKQPVEHKPALSTVNDDKKREKAMEAAQKHAMKESKSNKRAKQTALIVRSLIVGPTSAEPKMTATVAKPELNKIKSQLLEPKKANKLITQLRQLPARDEPSGNVSYSNGPIHAVCLAHSDAEEEALHFAKVASNGDASSLLTLSGTLSASVDKLTEMYKQMHVIDLIKSPDLGLGQPSTANGLLAGAVPTAGAIVQGFEQITPELLALGYATGKVVLPDHTGIHPPTDRMSVLTYWWGLELLLPPPSLVHLSNAKSIAGTVMNLLSALALVNNGVREILPFIRYVSQFLDFEFNAIKSQDKGNGVVCAATWIMPAAMVPRPWDFPLPPPTMPDNSEAGKQSVDEVNEPTCEVTTPPRAKPLISVLDVVTEAPLPTPTLKTPSKLSPKSSS